VLRVLCDSSGGAGRQRVVCEQDAQSDDRVAQTNHERRSGQNISIGMPPQACRRMQNMVFYWDYDDRIKPSTL